MEELNEAVERWYAAYNANLVAGLDSRLRRGGIVVPRAALWRRIPAEKLRELPDEETCRQVFASGVQTRKVAGDLTVSIVHPKAGRSMRYSVRDLPGAMVGMELRLQPLLTAREPLVIALVEKDGRETGHEIAPIVYDAAGFDAAAPVLGREYDRPKDTAREKAAKSKDNPGLAALMGPAHSFIRAENPFMRQSTGTAIEIAETVHAHEILTSAVEAAKRVMAECGDLPDGFIDDLRRRYPEGVSTRIVNEIIKERKPKIDKPFDMKGWVIEGGATDAPAGELGNLPGAEAIGKTA